MANTTITRTPSGAGNKRTWTLSFWMKKCSNGDSPHFFINTDGSGQYGFYCLFTSSDEFKFGDYTTNGNWDVQFVTNRVFRDNNAWYHFVITFDTTQSTQSDRVKFYVNGVQETSFSTSTYPSQNYQGAWNGANQLYIGSYINTSNYLNGCMSHIHFIDGTAYQASTFGSTDATTGEWKINTNPSVTYGSNGFFMLKDDNSLNDDSGNGNNFTLASGTFTKTEDNPSNVFATLNGVKPGLDQTLSNGNTTMVSGTATTRTPSQTTLGMSSGKYYAEFKITNSNNTVTGVVSSQDNSSVSRGTNYYPGHSALGWGYNGSGGFVVNSGSSVGGTWSTFAVGDIIGVAINLDDLQGGLNKLYFSKNGVWQNSADPSNHSSTTGVVGITAPSNTDEGFYYFSVGDGSGGTSSGAECNFGNGYFGTTAVASAGTNASGIGIFEYDVPTGYTALSTKGLNL